MMRRLAGILSLAVVSVLLLLLVGCDSDDEEAVTPTAATETTATATAAPAAQATQPSAAPQPPLTQEEAWDKLSRATVLIDDLPSGYAVQSDEHADNVAASATYSDPAGTQTFLDSAGRILGRTVVYLAENTTQAALAGLPVSYFSGVNAFQNTAGAGQYYAVAVQMISQGNGAGQQFAEVFADPDAVEVTSVTAATVGDESQAFDLTGEVEAAGQRYPATILLIITHRGRAVAFLGSVQIGIPPDVQEVEDLGTLLIDRIDQEF